MSGKLRCAVYTRKSSEEGLEQDFNSLHAQREACEAYVLSQRGEGWAMVPTAYDDGGISGATMERPGLQRLLADVQAGRIDVVVVYKVDRLTRSLADFARIVEIFDRTGASFVSVTQAFNTTTSMGRLTLNVLLSFAQFEREVTGERIRDKIAASKKKGLWMGGNIALGYDPNGRTLRINRAEAETVRHIFRRYIELKSVHALRDELQRQGVVSKSRTTRAGRQLGGVPMNRGALFHLLSNRLYLGEIPHKDASYPGQHEPIVDAEVFAAVQHQLNENAGPARRARAGLAPIRPSAPLTGRIRDEHGCGMTPVTARRGASQYRYYVAARAQQGPSAAGRRPLRVAALAIEEFVLDRVQRLGISSCHSDPWYWADAALVRVEVGRRRIQIALNRSELEACGDDRRLRARLADSDRLDLDDQVATLTCAVSLPRGGSKLVAGPHGHAAVERKRVDSVLLRALVKAEAWKAEILRDPAMTLERLGQREGATATFVHRTLRLAFLSPALKRSILDGRAPAGLNLQRLMVGGVADLWSEQQQQAAA